MKKRHIGTYLPEVILLLLCAVWLLYGISLKKGYHMDELLSFELANARFNPWIVPTQPQGRLAKFVENEIDGADAAETWTNLLETVRDVWERRGQSKLLTYKADVYDAPVWIDREQFYAYLTVDEKDAFNYLSVYFNVKDDNHPPLHFMLLHTVSSVFRGQISPLMGCGINLACVLGVMILLMWLARQFLTLFGQRERGRAVGLWTAGLYGFSCGAMSTTLLIRMYALVTFFCVALFAIHVRKLYAGRLQMSAVGADDFSCGNKRLIAVTVLGFWTQYFFLFYCILLAVWTVVYLWRNDRKREVGAYIRSMVIAALIGLIGFPFAIADVLSSGRGVEALASFRQGLAGYGERLTAFAGILAVRLGIAVLCIVGALLAAGMIGRLVKKQRVCYGTLLSLIGIPAVGYFLLAARMSPYMVDRYIMPIFPFCILFLTVSTCFVVRGRAVFVGVLVLTLLLQPAMTLRLENPYLYSDYPKQLRVSRMYDTYPCLCVSEGVGYYENLLEFMNYPKTLIVKTEELAAGSQELGETAELIVLLKDEVDARAVDRVLEEQYGLHRQHIVFVGGVYGDRIMLYGRAEEE